MSPKASTPSNPAPTDRHEWVSFDDPNESRTWIFDLTFLLSPWTCIFGSGCKGVLTEEAPELVQGCCSYGAHFTDDADMARTKAFVEVLEPDEWQFHAVGTEQGAIVQDEPGGPWTTRLHDDACILLNRPGFPGGPGCALHSAAIRRGLRHLDTKPDVCWQLPLRRVDSTDEIGHVTSTVREWKRRDWDEGGQEFAWWCTESGDAFVGRETVLSSMRDELVAMTTPEAVALLEVALAERGQVALPHPAIPVAAPKRRKRA